MGDESLNQNSPQEKVKWEHGRPICPCCGHCMFRRHGFHFDSEHLCGACWWAGDISDGFYPPKLDDQT